MSALLCPREAFWVAQANIPRTLHPTAPDQTANKQDTTKEPTRKSHKLSWNTPLPALQYGMSELGELSELREAGRTTSAHSSEDKRNGNNSPLGHAPEDDVEGAPDGDFPSETSESLMSCSRNRSRLGSCFQVSSSLQRQLSAAACEVSLLPNVLPSLGSGNAKRPGHELSAGHPPHPTSEHTPLLVGTGPTSSLPGSSQ